ncbi:MAG: hypothetical protein JNM14_06805 [Ferruginibacter sp.]|nr:hypothetical protein [Ferruginibacter sp.]
MKKIKTIKELQAEKKRIRQNQAMLENKVALNWKELKESLRPGNIARDAVAGMLNKTSSGINNAGFVKNILSNGIAILAGKLVDKAAKRFSKS